MVAAVADRKARAKEEEAKARRSLDECKEPSYMLKSVTLIAIDMRDDMVLK